jgi:formate dehydrogenase major subunit
MTNTWPDIATADVIMVIGGNPAENHPLGFKHMRKALDNAPYGPVGPAGTGAKLIVCDPRYTRTASKASVWNGRKMYIKFRSGTDIPLINAVIWQVMKQNLYNRTYVLAYSNAGFLVNEGFLKPGDAANPNKGKYSGHTATASFPGLGDTGSYDKTTWQYCKYVAGHTLEYKAVNIATDFWDGSGGTPDSYWANGGLGTNYSFSNLSLDPVSPTYIENLKADLFIDGKLGGGDGFNSSQKTVWQHMQEHYARYSKAKARDICGCTTADIDDIVSLYGFTGTPGKAGTIMYAMGTTQHTVGTQNIRGYSTLQVLLGNMGVSGGGVNAQRGESNVQGSTDHCLLFHILPGYITMPASTNAGDKWFDRTNALTGDGTPGHPLQLPSYVKRGTPFTGHANELNWWGFWAGQSNFKRYIVSLMKNYWYMSLGAGANPNTAATAAQLQAVYDYIPKLPGNASHIEIFEQMHAGNIQGCFAIGQNPAVGGPNSIKEREAMRNLDWLVVSELWETETAAFWQFSPEGEKLNDAAMADINTEVFLLPAAASLEKEGSVTNSARWAQYRYKAVEPPGGAVDGAKHEIEMLNMIYDALRATPQLMAYPPFFDLCMGTWWYSMYGGIVPNPVDPPADVLDAEINGFAAAPFGAYPVVGDLIAAFTTLQDDGRTMAGNWLYTNMYTGGNIIAGTGTNKSKNRTNAPAIPPGGGAPIFSSWAWDWPVNRRIIYNGASIEPNPSGVGGVGSTPWDPLHAVITWTGAAWAGDVNDGVGGANGTRTPFIMKPEGHCRLHGFGRAEGPYPEHYEPLDTLFNGLPNPIGPAGNFQVINPAIKVYEPGKIGKPIDGYDIVATTYRCTEHWQAGAQTRHLPWQSEIWPDVCVEMSQDLANSIGVGGIQSGDKVRITSARGDMVARAIVTNRFTTYVIDGAERHHIGVFWHWGFKGIATGHSANRLTPHVGDANTRIPEYKAFLVKIEPAV